MDETEKPIKSDAAAALITVRPQTLALWRSKGKGPRYLKVGTAVRYRISDIKQWLESRVKGTIEEPTAV